MLALYKSFIVGGVLSRWHIRARLAQVTVRYIPKDPYDTVFQSPLDSVDSDQAPVTIDLLYSYITYNIHHPRLPYQYNQVAVDVRLSQSYVLSSFFLDSDPGGWSLFGTGARGGSAVAGYL